MGCISNKIIFQSNQECDNLMKLNLLILRAIEIISLRENRQSFAMYIIYIHKSTEKFYSLTKKYRECWKNCINNSSSCRVNHSFAKRFQMMQDAEKNFLLKSNMKFSEIICQLEPNSKKDFSDLCSFMIYLSSNKDITRQLKPLYSKFEDCSETQLKQSISLFEKLSETEESIINDIRRFTIDTYSDPLNIVYYKESFEFHIESCKDSMRSTTAKNSIRNSYLGLNLRNLEDAIYSSESFNAE